MKTVVVIDDNMAVRTLLEDCMKMEGHQSVSFPDGTDIGAIRAAKPDLIILDLVLPGKPGLEVLEEIRNDGTLKNVPVMVISASLNLRSMERGEGIELLEKPFDLTDLFAKVSLLLQSSQTQGNGS